MEHLHQIFLLRGIPDGSSIAWAPPECFPGLKVLLLLLLVDLPAPSTNILLLRDLASQLFPVLLLVVSGMPRLWPEVKNKSW